MMKKFLFAFITISAFMACNQNPKGYVVEGSLRGDLEDGTKVFLRKQGENRQPVDVDTTTTLDGKFTFTGEAAIPEMHYIFLENAMGYSAIVLENGKISLSAHMDSLGLSKLEGTPQNEVFTDYLKKSKDISEKARSIQQDIQTATMSKDTASLVSLRDEMMELQDEYKNFELTYIREHPTALISALLIDRAMGSQSVSSEEIQELYDGLSPEIKETKVAKSVLERLQSVKEREERKKSTSIGAKAPDFSAPTPTGGELALNEALGKVTLVDFWAAWCKPCRAENPNVVKVYEKYHGKGLNIVGVSLDKTKAAWEKAIADDGLTWNHVSNLAYFDDEIAKLYGVDAIPAAFLLDENGVIVAKNLRGPALEAKVAELLQ
ncbi:TlpA disulfide reductase family protein [Ulvibacterium sp.]|uniref:TlpA disulfide reductase family protein n=1 Tax=Ulvibacterium sp. TaxID=2665914 RepID=UPI00261FDFCF|nr:TlpA disulfide reductase family protein [Ulvibacterium sp.]